MKLDKAFNEGEFFVWGLFLKKNDPSFKINMTRILYIKTKS